MKQRWLSLLLVASFFVVELSSVWDAQLVSAQSGQPGDPVVTGLVGLTASAQVFPYDVDLYGIYLVQGDQMTLVTSVPVEHINTDRVTAKLSPDLLKIAYLVEFGGTGFSQLKIVGADGLNSSVLFESDHAGRYITSFEWSHDSQRIAYALSRDPFGAAPDVAASFENPTAAIDPLAETTALDDPLALTGEVWVTNLNGTEQTQLVDQGAMDVLGWTGSDTDVFFTRLMTATAESPLMAAGEVTETRNLTPTAPFAAGVSFVQTDAITNPLVSDLVTNTIPISGDIASPLYTGFYLLESSGGAQMLAATSTALPFESLPFTDTTLSLMNLPAGNLRRVQQPLTLTPVLTNAQAIVNVGLSPDGLHVAYLTEQSGQLWAASNDGLGHTEVVTGGLSTATPIVWGTTNDRVAAASLDSDDIGVFALAGTDLGNLSAIQSEAMQIEPLTTVDVKNYNVPFIHQVWDMPDWFGGYCACGPTSAAMALAFYDKLSPNPITLSQPYSHQNSFGFYVPEKFGSFQSVSVRECGRGDNQYGFGIYGNSMDPGRYAWAYKIQNSIQKLGISTTFDGSATFNEIKSALDRGHLVVLSTQLTGAGHIVLVRGYRSDNSLIVNDPYGNKHQGYGRRVIDGGNVNYSWSMMGPKWFIEVNGTPPTGGGGCGGGTPTITHWKGEYFTNRDVSGQPALVRNDTEVNFNWGSGSPSSCIGADDFSARWTRTMYFERGAYRFRVGADDGVRLFVDDQRLIDAWRDQGFTYYDSGDKFLDGGNHTIKMEYYEHGGAAAAQLSWQQVGSPGTGWTGQYFNNRSLSGNPTITRNDDSLYFSWGNGGPGGGIGNDNFSVRWTKNLNVPRTGWYAFYVRSDDGVRVWVDNVLQINAWRDQAPTTYASPWLYLASGNHSVKVEYYENGGGAFIHLWLVPAFYTQFFNNTNLSGNPNWSGYYSGVWFDWGGGGPSGTGSDNFSARWTGSLSLSGGRYKFCTRTDDGVRLYVDNSLTINRWQDQAPTTYCADRDLGKGFHDLKMEYYERGGGAVAQLWWSKYSGTDAVLKASLPMSNTDEADIWALYNDAGYLGPLVETDISTTSLAPTYTIFLPLLHK